MSQTFFIVEVSYALGKNWHQSESLRRKYTSAQEARNGVLEYLESHDVGTRKYRVSRITTTSSVVYADIEKNLNPVLESSV